MIRSLNKKTLFSLGIGLAVVAIILFVGGATNRNNDARFQDQTFSEAVNLAKGLRSDPMCIGFGKMMLSQASPEAGSEFYRAEVLNRIASRIPQSCIASDGSEPPAEIIAFIRGTAPRN
ncbi:hypothetical protein [Herbaspirillum lusitanum]|uniref:hypothetical protein n=1 Tax=Herbaspirillum lusitanum TaxID=213312 RepID=UPI0012F47C51|nr:hypothetical protein [Herbaspirillum lusitanum]